MKEIKTRDLFDCQTSYLKLLFENSEYPWEMLPKIKEYVLSLIREGIPGYRLYSDQVLVGENVTVYPTATVEGPCVIGSGTVIRPGAYLRGCVITGENCVLLDRVQAPHYNYVGDSVLGNRAHVGAGVICSNLKNDGQSVVIHGEKDYETGLRKVGAILADGANIGSQCVLNPGTVIGKNTSVYPLNSLRGVYASESIVKDRVTVVLKK